MGFDGPLAALSQERVNLADYFKETVAVVTNPAIDRGREYEAFSTRTVIGTRPEIVSSIYTEEIHPIKANDIMWRLHGGSLYYGVLSQFSWPARPICSII